MRAFIAPAPYGSALSGEELALRDSGHRVGEGDSSLGDAEVSRVVLPTAEHRCLILRVALQLHECRTHRTALLTSLLGGSAVRVL